ncbi:conserved hypothetical protein [Methylocella silvestris BL2]|uniref:Terminase n=1 Tax=Methylocella silvestris (strain DSM 15510 / CIP 108128 / LMG 27833 / NCIMB 13906 / BL2) TaxID=395965 RepID=B8EKX2_METSB|nr:hypothetical protein [Methylocella silvestris]ACK52000.1 conserved hypothetical protein [Methylocella silvestris BL2]
MNIIDAIDDPHLLGSAIRDHESWKPWRAMLAAVFGLPLDDYGAELFRQCTGRAEAQGAAFGFLWLVIGRRGGKTFAMALLACFLGLFRDWTSRLAPGERAVVLLVAADREQAKILRRYISGILEAPMLAKMVEAETADTIELKGRVVIEVATCSYRTVRGRSVCVALLDEVAFWRRDDSVSPDTEVFVAIRASMATFGDDAMMVVASSPYSKSGLLWTNYRKYFGKPDAQNLVWQAATRTMNPSVPQSFIDAEIERDPVSAAAEYGAQFRTDVAAFVDREAIEACVASGRRELPPAPGVRYVAFADPSGGSSDSMTLGICHAEKDKRIVLDVIREIRPPFSPDAVVSEFAETLKAYRLASVTGDRYGGEWPRERFRVHGIRYDLSEKVRSEIYLAMLPLINSGRVELLDNSRLVAQLAGLERRTARSGRDSVDHGPGGHDDVANSVAGGLVLASQTRAPMIITPELLALSARPSNSRSAPLHLGTFRSRP